jgi:hypothetical protein
LRFPQQIVAQVMNIGVFRDLNRLAEELGDEILRDVLRNAEAGQFSERSWHYWHYRLRMSRLDEVPPLPARFVPASWILFSRGTKSGRQRSRFSATSALGGLPIPWKLPTECWPWPPSKTLFATKVKTLLQRTSAKDDQDIAALIRAGLPLDRALAAAELMFHPTFAPAEAARALACFKGGDLDRLSKADRETLVGTVPKVRTLPEVTIRPGRLPT